MDNVKIHYYARENKQLGSHSFYPQPIGLKTFGFERMCQKAARNTSIEAHTVRAAVEEYIKVAKEALLEGNRVEIGEQFVTLWPNLKGSVKDNTDPETGKKVVVTAADLTATKCKSRVSATVNAVFSDEFERKVKWVKTDKHGNVIDEPDDTETNEELTGGDTGGGEPSSGGGTVGTGGGDEHDPME